MNWKQQGHPLERGAVVVAALSLGGAVAFAVVALAPLMGHALTGAALLGGLFVAGAGLALLQRVGGATLTDREGFSLIDFVEADDEQEAQAADQRTAEDELLLDDPIAPLDPNSRVIRLFHPEQPEPLPEPGELVARIADYLDSGRGAARPVADNEPVRHDARAALHAALADIRRSLR